MFASYMDREIVSSDSFVKSFELLSEEPTFDVKVENTRVIHEDRERSVSQVDGRLTENLVQDGSVLLCKQQHQRKNVMRSSKNANLKGLYNGF